MPCCRPTRSWHACSSGGGEGSRRGYRKASPAEGARRPSPRGRTRREGLPRRAAVGLEAAAYRLMLGRVAPPVVGDGAVLGAIGPAGLARLAAEMEVGLLGI